MRQGSFKIFTEELWKREAYILKISLKLPVY